MILAAQREHTAVAAEFSGATRLSPGVMAAHSHAVRILSELLSVLNVMTFLHVCTQFRGEKYENEPALGHRRRFRTGRTELHTKRSCVEFKPFFANKCLIVQIYSPCRRILMKQT